MPTTYTHDLFGKYIYKRLPGEMQEVIRENGDLYRIGLHGPDILFYLLPVRRVTDTGVRMHKEIARSFFETGMETVRETGSRPLLAYLLGFGCHYLLDSRCHPTVNRMDEEGRISHTLSEKELDRTLMLETGKNPLKYYPSDCIVPKMSYAEVIHQAIPEISAKKIYWSLRMMKVITNSMVYDNKGRRKKALAFIGNLVYGVGAKAALEHFMEKEPLEGSAEPVRELKQLFDEALEESPGYLEELFALSKEDGVLSERFDRTYNG